MPNVTSGLETRRRMFGRSVVTGALLTTMFAAAAALAHPSDLNLSLDRTTDHAAFRVQAVGGLKPIPISRIHQWSVHLTGPDGAPIIGAEIVVDGGMPEHGHGLPTTPRAEAAAAAGDYVIKGMKFSMSGWWELKLDIKARDGRTDQITFNLVL